MKSVVVVGAGLLGTSVGLALRAAGVAVFLLDREPRTSRLAAELGAGEPGAPPQPAELAVIAVPPSVTAQALAAAQRQHVAETFTDVASVKAVPLAEARTVGADLTCFVGGHPLAGGERSGPGAARHDLFQGRPWVLTPTAESGAQAVDRARTLAELCGATPLVMDPQEHDDAVALVSHLPHLLSSLVAARLTESTEVALRLAGQGVRDVTRVAASDWRLWVDILTSNAPAVSAVLEPLVDELGHVLKALQNVAGDPAARQHLPAVHEPSRERGAASGSGDHGSGDHGSGDHGSGDHGSGDHGSGDHGSGDHEVLAEALRRGNAGRARLPGKHGAPPTRYSVVPVVIEDRPGELGRLVVAAGEAGVNIEDVTIEHAPGAPVGLVEIAVRPESADRLAQALRERGWSVH